MMEQIARNQGQMSALDKVFLEAVNTFPPQTSKQDKSSNRFIKKFAPTGLGENKIYNKSLWI
jgi:hypothetical protein